MEPLDFEEWLESSTGTGYTMEELLNIEFAESGMDREMCFDLEAEQEKRYQNYIDAIEAYPLVEANQQLSYI